MNVYGEKAVRIGLVLLALGVALVAAAFRSNKKRCGIEGFEPL